MNKLALISVYDKTNIFKLAEALTRQEYKILSTGGTAKLLKDSGIEATEISNVTGFPEIFGGRVKTLHPVINGGILMRRDVDNDLREAKENNIFPIDVVCVNLYPFKEVTGNPDVAMNEAIENIDIGGPSLVRAAAKNYKFVSVLTNPKQYDNFITELQDKELSLETRKKLALEAFSHTANYDSYIANFLEKRLSGTSDHIRVNYSLEKSLRYGENPHQKAEVYGDFYSYFEELHGKELSYNNILDLVSAVDLVDELGENACAIIKHNNPAGAAIGNDALDAYNKALKCDPVSAFGGIVTFSNGVDEKLAEKLNEIFLEVVCAPGYSDDALSILRKKKNRRILKKLKSTTGYESIVKSVPGGIIRQDADKIGLVNDKLKTVTDRKPGKRELEDLLFAWKVAKHTKSNSIVFVKDKTTLGVGAGQMSRIDSVKIARMKAGEQNLDLKGSVAASDAFFPFADGLIEIAKEGATSVIQPGGSVRDDEVVAAANKNNISMVFTGIRHFKH